MTVHLRGRRDFQNVYRKGRRYDGLFISVFVLPNELSCHRFGVTASKKALGKAVERNRAKRLLRESFRLSDGSLTALEKKYDWVLNAKGRLAGHKLGAAFEEFSSVVQKVACDETATWQRLRE